MVDLADALVMHITSDKMDAKECLVDEDDEFMLKTYENEMTPVSSFSTLSVEATKTSRPVTTKRPKFVCRRGMFSKRRIKLAA